MKAVLIKSPPPAPGETPAATATHHGSRGGKFYLTRSGSPRYAEAPAMKREERKRRFREYVKKLWRTLFGEGEEPFIDDGQTMKTGAALVELERAREETDTSPTDRQKEAGNYRKGVVRMHGLEIALENPKGSTRSGTAADGTRWESTLAHDYGYVKRSNGADGDPVDVFIGPDHESELVFVVDQVKADGTFDEHKTMLGFTCLEDARAGYLANYPPGWKCGPITTLTIEQFKQWLRDGNTQKPIERKIKLVLVKSPRPGEVETT